MTWTAVTELLEEFVQRDLVTTAKIERAYQSDEQLFWRIVKAFALVSELKRAHSGRFKHVLTWCAAFRPYFDRSRVRKPGNATQTLN